MWIKVWLHCIVKRVKGVSKYHLLESRHIQNVTTVIKTYACQQVLTNNLGLQIQTGHSGWGFLLMANHS